MKDNAMLDLTPEEKWERATLANNFIFYKVMRHHPDVCQRLIEMLLGVEIENMEIHNEESIDLDHSSKGIRLDVYVKDSKRMFDIELQIANTGELPERSRYYASLMALDSLKTGEPYDKLKDSHVIFICMEDVFKKKLPVYAFENRCGEDAEIKLGDRDYKYFFIAPICATMFKNEEVKSFFRFLISNNADSDLTLRLKDYVKDAKQNMQWRFQYMTWERQRAYDLREGQRIGERQKALEAALVLIKDFNATPELAAEKMGASLEDVLKALETENSTD